MPANRILKSHARRGAVIIGAAGGGTIIGSIGSWTFQRNPFGNLVRSRVKPVDPNTPRQQEVKAYMTQAATAWNALTVAQVQAWKDYAAATPITGPKGQQIVLSGRQMYMRSKMFQLRGFFGPLEDAPALPGELQIPLGTVTYSVVDGNITLTGLTNFPASGVVRFLISRNLRSTRNYWKGPFNQTYQHDTATLLPVVIGNITPFPTAGDKIFLQYKAWDANTNAVSPDATFPVVAA